MADDTLDKLLARVAEIDEWLRDTWRPESARDELRDELEMVKEKINKVMETHETND
jgi:hypothetical protein